jgi:hypothetical protein
MSVLREIDAAVGDLVAAAGPSAQVVAFSTSDFQPNGSLQHLMPEIVERLNAIGGAHGARCSVLPYNEACAALIVAGSDPRRLSAIETELCDLRDADTDERVVAAISRPSSEMAGSRVAELPDLLVHSPPGSLPRAVVSPRLGRIEADVPSMRPGNHEAGGFVIAAGASAVARIDDVRTMAGFASLAKAVLDRESLASI